MTITISASVERQLELGATWRRRPGKMRGCDWNTVPVTEATG
jgi:hypothetical protein